MDDSSAQRDGIDACDALLHAEIACWNWFVFSFPGEVVFCSSLERGITASRLSMADGITGGGRRWTEVDGDGHFIVGIGKSR